VENLLSLWKVLAQDMGGRCAVDTILDYNYVEDRTEREGQSFLTIALPKFGKSFEKWLDQGFVDPGDVPGFKVRQKLPIFMGRFLRLVFCSASGMLLPDPNVDAILAVRQLCGFYGKMQIPVSTEKLYDAMDQYLSTDDEVGRWQKRNPLPVGRAVKVPTCDLPPTLRKEDLALLRMSMLLLHRVFGRVNHDLANGVLTPKHGPGATAEKLLGNAKWLGPWHWRLDSFFPADQYWLPNARYVNTLQEIDFRNPEDESPVRVIAVPKTQSAPRIIAAEPVCMQYTQQAIARGIKEGVKQDYILKHFLRFKRQEVNQLLAWEGSKTGALATLDLSEASDRIPNELVRFLTGRWEHLDGAIQASRSTRAVIRTRHGEQIVPLAKFASMGSGLTFPLETIIFLMIAFVGIEDSIGRRLRKSDIVGLIGKVQVYGDDMIVPVEHVGSVVHTLEAFGFKVNYQKSFWTGKFRESCGKDYYNGQDVSYVKFRKQWPDDRQDVKEVIALVSLFNQCNDAAYTLTAAYLKGKLLELLEGYFPRVSRDSQILGEWSDVEHDITRLGPKTHRPETKGWVVVDSIPKNPLDGERALLKFFLKQGIEPYERTHLTHSGRSRAVSIKLYTGPV